MEKKVKKNPQDRFARRLARELSLNANSREFDFATDDNTWYFRFTVQDGLYANQTHIIGMRLLYGRGPDTCYYPANPPLCRFITPIFHPNVNPEQGAICLDVLNDQWSVSMVTAKALQAIELLLSNPNPRSPNNIEAARLMKNPKMYKDKIDSVYENHTVPERIEYLLNENAKKSEG
jgi:ubiquitin-protein ligase